jgi:hypothetical protein
MSSNIEEQIDRIEKVLDDSPVRAMSLHVAKAMAALPVQELSHLSYTSIANLARVSDQSVDLIRCVAFLTSEIANVLSPMFVYIADDEKEYVLTREQYSKAKRDGYLVDPHSGEHVKDFLTRTFPYFRATDEFRENVAHQ